MNRLTRTYLTPVLVVLLLPGLRMLEAGDSISAGVASRDITPEEPVWLSGYAARSKASTSVASRLTVKAVTLESGGQRTVLVSLDNCEVTGDYTAPALAEIETRFGIPPDGVIIVSSHTHSAPVLEGPLPGMFQHEGVEAERIHRYSERLRSEIVGVVGESLETISPARLYYGTGRASFAMNRRVYHDGRATFGENPDAPVDYDVPVLKITDADGGIRAILFGYSCHGTTIGGASGEEFYAVSGDYMAYARDHLEAAFPGSQAVFLTGFGADINPSPRGTLGFSRQHGLELAGAVAGVLTQPMRPLAGGLKRVSRRIRLSLVAPPAREQIEVDSRSENRYVRNRARIYLDALAAGKPRPTSVDYPLSVLRIGDDLTLVCLAGEVVIDYALRLKRELRFETPWTIGYAAEVPCYIPSRRILNEGGYEALDSLVYYGIYGPFEASIEDRIVSTVKEMVEEAKADQGFGS